MKGSSKSFSVSGAVALLIATVLFSGCSSKSPYNLYIDSIQGALGTANSLKDYLECDIIGSKTYPCSSEMDTATVTVRIEKPGTLGPDLRAYLTGYSIDYFYYDPADGMLKGPVAGLTMSTSNLRTHAFGTVTSVTIPVITFRVKAWSVGVTCDDMTGFPGASNVNRIVARITIQGEDTTGKRMSAQGSILAFLDDYTPSPQDPALNSLPEWSSCYGQGGTTYWSTRCP